MPLKTYKKLYEACIKKIMFYVAGIWGFGKFSCMEKIQNRAMRCFLGVHKYAPFFALQGEMAFLSTITSRKLEGFGIEFCGYPMSAFQRNFFKLCTKTILNGI